MILGMTPGDRGTTNPTVAGFLTGGDIAAQISRQEPIAGTPGVVAVPSPTVVADAASGAPLRGFADLFYFRVWTLPNVLDVQNPVRNSPIPFRLWNAYLGDNELLSITPTDATGVTLDIIAGEVLPALAMRTVEATIGDAAPIQIDASFAFDFANGNALLRFIALLADILPIEPNSTIVENLEWKTDVLTNRDGSEQRIALRLFPRRTFKLSLSLMNDVERKVLYDKLFKTAALTLIAPSYQYQSRLKVKTVLGDNKVYTNTRRADLRAGENVLIVTKAGVYFLYTIDAVFADHVTITTAFSQVVPAGSIVCGAFNGRFNNKSAIAMNSISGQSELSLLLENSRAQVQWPDYAATVPTLNGKPMLLKNPIADLTGEAFDVGLEAIDNETGKISYFSPWSQPMIEGNRSYLVQSLLDQDDLEFWRTFLDTVRGMQKTFYTPTYRADLVRFDGSNFLVSEITVEGTSYASLYADSPAYSQLEIECDLGTFQVAVSSVENLGDRTRISFVDPIAVDVSDAVVSRISYLMLVRLGNDTVVLTHNASYTMVDLSLRMAVQ